jgi:hypothetical protein
MRAPHTIISLAVITATASVAVTPVTSAQAATQRHTGPVTASAKRKSRHTGPVALAKKAGSPVSLDVTPAKLSRMPGNTTAPCKGAGPLTRGPEFISRRHRLQLMSASATCIGDIEY